MTFARTAVEPRKAVAFIKINITVPIVHTKVLGALYDP